MSHLFQESPLGLRGRFPLPHPGRYAPLCCCAGSSTGGRAAEKAEQASREFQTVSRAKKLREQRDMHQEGKRKVASQHQ